MAAYSGPLTAAFVKTHPTLVLDTRHFGLDFTDRVLKGIDDLDASVEGILLNSEDFHALSIMQKRYLHSIGSIYIDPPYNTDAGPIVYKNCYRHASWLAMMDNRLELSQRLMTDDAILCVTIDDIEVHNLRSLLDSVFTEFDLIGAVPIKNNPAGRTGTVGFSICHEYALFYGQADFAKVGRMEHSEAQIARYKERDELGRFEWTNFRKHCGLNTYRDARPRQFYPIYVTGDVIRIPDMEWDDYSRTYAVLDEPKEDEEILLPIDENRRERIWDFVVDTARANLPHLMVRKDTHGATAIYRKWRLNEQGILPKTRWDKSVYSAAKYGTNLLTNIFGSTHAFTFPKSIHAVADCLRVANLNKSPEGIALDFFGGSGTTGHAVINLNREDGGKRRFILVEMGDYFDTVLLPRIKKVTFSPEWKDGKPKRLATPQEFEYGPRIVKVLRLESYEDALNNLVPRRTAKQDDLLASAEARGAERLKEQYMLRYMLDVETRGSQSLLNVKAFSDPTAYKLKVKRPGSDESREVNVDLLETFNWLVGLAVQGIAAPQSFTAEFERDAEGRLTLKGRLRQDVNGPFWFRTVTGTRPDGRRTLIIWRKLTGRPEQDNLVLDI